MLDARLPLDLGLIIVIAGGHGQGEPRVFGQDRGQDRVDVGAAPCDEEAPVVGDGALDEKTGVEHVGVDRGVIGVGAGGPRLDVDDAARFSSSDHIHV